MRRPGPYQVQAAIAALHDEAATPADTDWNEIAILYGTLARMTPSPVIELNRAVAVAMVRGPAAGLAIVDGIGATEMMHIFISAAGKDIRPGATGKAVPGYVACVLDGENRPMASGTGRLAVKGPTGCRYLDDPRQADYVVDGWNVTGDTYRADDEGYFWYVARSDDMIVSSGYNIAAPEVENALHSHAAVQECAVIGQPCAERGQKVKAFVVPGYAADAVMAGLLQDHVKATIAPYKYPREVEFVAELPKTATGKLQRFALKES